MADDLTDGTVKIDGNTVRFPREHKEHFAPDQNVIDMIEKLLGWARKGKLTAIAFGVVYADSISVAGQISSGWVLKPGTRWALNCAIDKLALAYHHDAFPVADAKPCYEDDKPPDPAA